MLPPCCDHWWMGSRDWGLLCRMHCLYPLILHMHSWKPHNGQVLEGMYG